MNMFTMIASNPKGFSDVALSRSAFVATNPTPGTGIASKAAAQSRSATAGLLQVFNSANTNGTEPYVVIPVWLKLIATQANTNATDFTLDFYTDTIDRYASGGTVITEVELINSGVPDFTKPTSKATIQFGELTLNAASDENLVASRRLATAIMADDDSYEIYWGGGPDGGGRDGTVMRGPGPVVVPPMWIHPGASLTVHEYGASMTNDPAFEFEFFYVEKPNSNQAA